MHVFPWWDFKVSSVVPFFPASTFKEHIIKYLPKNITSSSLVMYTSAPSGISVSMVFSPMSPYETLYPPQCAAFKGESFVISCKNHPAMSKQCPLVVSGGSQTCGFQLHTPGDTDVRLLGWLLLVVSTNHISPTCTCVCVYACLVHYK